MQQLNIAVYHFADDTNLLNINSSPKQLQKHLNIDLKQLYMAISQQNILKLCKNRGYILP